MLQGEGKIAQFAALSSTGRNGNVTLLEARNTTAAMVVSWGALLGVALWPKLKPPVAYWRLRCAAF
jgi:hypothetical protein